MPTTIDRFYAVVQITQNLSTMQNEMRVGILDIQANFKGTRVGGSPLQGNLPAIQQTVRDRGAAFQQRLDKNAALIAAFPAQLSAGATAVGIAPADVTSIQALMVTWATNHQTATFATGADLDTLVTNLLAAVPVAMLAF